MESREVDGNYSGERRPMPKNSNENSEDRSLFDANFTERLSHSIMGSFDNSVLYSPTINVLKATLICYVETFYGAVIDTGATKSLIGKDKQKLTSFGAI